MHARVYPAPMTTSASARTPAAAQSDPAFLAGLQGLLQHAEVALVLRRVYLFGSRARGDARPDSDLDLAFEHESSPEAWAQFVNAAQDQAPILLDLDLVDMASAAPELRERILSEGRLLRG
ncbi:MAG: nucleotidyltransferase family protein [Candidatus Binatia bacterium]